MFAFTGVGEGRFHLANIFCKLQIQIPKALEITPSQSSQKKNFPFEDFVNRPSPKTNYIFLEYAKSTHPRNMFFGTHNKLNKFPEVSFVYFCNGKM